MLVVRGRTPARESKSRARYSTFAIAAHDEDSYVATELREGQGGAPAATRLVRFVPMTAARGKRRGEASKIVYRNPKIVAG